MKEVVTGIINKDNKILMIKRAKNEGNLLWAFPGGKVEEGENKEEACIREIYEETGIKVQIQKILGERIHPDTEVKITYFLCNYLSGQITIMDKTEILDIAYMNKNEFYNCIKSDIFLPVKEYIEQHIK